MKLYFPLIIGWSLSIYQGTDALFNDLTLKQKQVHGGSGKQTANIKSVTSGKSNTIDVATVSQSSVEEERNIYGPWIVQLNEEVSDHDSFLVEAEKIHNSYKSDPEKHKLALSKGFNVFHKFKRLLNAVVIEGVTAEHIQTLAGVKTIGLDTLKYAMVTDDWSEASTTYFWGQDRIDQSFLPLDTAPYNPDFVGAGVDVYVVDTGIDTNHIDFNASLNVHTRTVENIYNPYGVVDSDTDDHGHGTHCAGTVGGWFSGVAKAANIYGVKILDNQGSGSTSTIVNSLEWIIDNHLTGRPAVFSMSLGGPCSPNCGEDALVRAVDAAVEAGVVVVVAAGNERCNAQYGSPASSPRAITVGATNNIDDPAFFSNFGEFVDILAPGYDIYSACCHDVCGSDEDWLVEYSGTSMACPHVAGIVAQLLEKNATATPEAVQDALLCDAIRGTVALDPRDTISKNLLAQVPQNDGGFGGCNLGLGCEYNCSNHGYCAPAHSLSAYGSTENKCFCHSEFGGEFCEMSADNFRSQSCASGLPVRVRMYPGSDDTYGTGWDYSSGFAIYDNNTGSHLVAPYARDSMCQSSSTGYDDGKRDYCLQEGCYTMDSGRVPTWLPGASSLNAQNSWSVCGISGVGNEKVDFCVFQTVGGALACDVELSSTDDDDEDDVKKISVTMIAIISVAVLVVVVAIIAVVVFATNRSGAKQANTLVKPVGVAPVATEEPPLPQQPQQQQEGMVVHEPSAPVSLA